MTSTKPNKTAVVIGAGASGISAAISIAKNQDFHVLLLEKKPEIGGTVSHSLIHTLGGLYNSSGDILNQGLPQELIQRLTKADKLTVQRKIGKTWVLAVDPETYTKVVQDWLDEYKNIEVRTSATDLSIKKNTQGNLVESISFRTNDKSITIDTDAIVDASGSAGAVRLIEKELVIDDNKPAMAAIVFQLLGIDHSEIKAPRNIALMRKIRAAVSCGELPRQLASTWLDIGTHANEIYVKASIPVPDKWYADDGELFMKTVGIDAVNKMLEFLKSNADMPGATLGKVGALGIRDGGRVKGRYQLTEDDLRSRKKFSNAACRCCWPIEYWHPEKGVTLEYFPDNEYYDIPLSALQVHGMDNVWSVGKCLSADHLAQASARVVGTCWAMGDAAGKNITGQKP